MPAPDSRPTVFVVDDDAGMRASLAWLLAANGLAARTFTAADALLAALTPADTGCVLIDLRRPGLAGPPLLDALAARDIALPVILLSGDLAADDAIATLRPRLFAILPKPCADERLLGRIRAALAHQRATGARRP